MRQSKLASLVEAMASTALGYGVALVSQLVIFPLYGVNISLDANLQIVAWFTAISLVRGYCVRRYFEWRLRRRYNPQEPLNEVDQHQGV